MENIKVPTYLITSDSDAFSTLKDSDKLYNKLSPEARIFGRYMIKGFNHHDFLYGKRRQEIIYDKILQLIEKI